MHTFKIATFSLTPVQQFRFDVMEHGLELAVRIAIAAGVSPTELKQWTDSLGVVSIAKRTEGLGGIKLEML